MKTPNVVSYDAPVIRLEKDAVRWEIVADFAPLFDRVLNDAGQVVKQSSVKRVTEHRINDRVFFRKWYGHQVVPLRPLKFFFKPAPARQEWNLAQQLQALQVPIVRHVALGERWSWGGLQESFLITEGFEGCPLDKCDRVEANAILAFVKQLHARGVLQRDLHPGNILFNPATGEMRLVDLHGTVVRPSLSSGERVANLAFLRIFLPIPVSADIARQSAQLRKRYYAHRARRCLKHNREFAPRYLGNLVWRVRLPSLNPAAERVLSAPDEFLASRAEILKPGRASTVGRADGLVLKRYNLRRRKRENLLKDLFRGSKARRAFLKAYHLELVGIPTARPIATADVRRARILLRSYFLMEEIPDAVDLGQWRGDPRPAVQAVAKLIARLHNEGFMHRDLKETNIVFNHAGRVFLLDLEGLDYVGTVSHPRAAADLARLARAARNLPQFSQADWQALLSLYYHERGIPPRDLGNLQSHFPA